MPRAPSRKPQRPAPAARASRPARGAAAPGGTRTATPSGRGTGRDADWTRDERALFESLRTPAAIQAFLDATPYNDDTQCRSPRGVLRDRRAHCMEGALFAAAALRFLGDRARIVDLKATRDDDHVIAVYQRNGAWGSIAKSNMTGLRGREPVYRTLRELALSYFADYFNTERERTLRSFSRAVDLRRFDRMAWMTTEADLDPIGVYLETVPHEALFTARQIAAFTPVDDKTWDANMLGVNANGLYWVHLKEGRAEAGNDAARALLERTAPRA